MRIIWIHAHCKKVFSATARFNVLPNHAYLLERGFESVLVTSVEEAIPLIKDNDVVICMSPDDADKLVGQKIDKLIVFQSDGPIASTGVLNRAQAIVVDSTFLTTRIPPRYRGKVHYIPDALELDKSKFIPHKYPVKNKEDWRLVWIGSSGNYFFAEPVINALRSAGWTVDCIGDNPSTANVVWDVNTYADEINKRDIGIVPYPVNLRVENTNTFDNFWYKDNNRVVTLQACGIPVVCSALPSFLQYVEHLCTGVIANRIEDWVNVVEDISAEPFLYNNLASEGYKQAWRYADLKVTTRMWMRLIQGVFHAR